MSARKDRVRVDLKGDVVKHLRALASERGVTLVSLVESAILSVYGRPATCDDANQAQVDLELYIQEILDVD